jgi:FAD:protein FMN transferase
LKKALDIAQVTDGAFDPTVLPLANAWGFGPAKNITVTKKIIDSLKSFVGYQKIRLTKDSVQKSDARVQLDFGGIGQGYGADVLAEFLRSKNISDFLVELGGEGVAAGSNLKKNSPWKIGILDPRSTQENQIVKAYVDLKNRSFTTSGNYFNYRIIEGRRYGHTLDPRTGYPVQHSLLSASVFAKDAATADAWATALMVAGVEKAILLLKRNREIDAFLIFSAAGAAYQIYATPGIEKLITIDH